MPGLLVGPDYSHFLGLREYEKTCVYRKKKIKFFKEAEEHGARLSEDRCKKQFKKQNWSNFSTCLHIFYLSLFLEGMSQLLVLSKFACIIGRARTVYKGLYNWPDETIGKQRKQLTPLVLTTKEVQINNNESK